MPIKEDTTRENRILMEILVDAYDESERAMGWFYYLQDTIKFPFKAKCMEKRAVSPLEKGEEVEILDMASEDECEHEILVNVLWEKRKLALPLAQLEPMNADAKTQEAVADWHYWVKRGYEF
jgi:hypothetical protein